MIWSKFEDRMVRRLIEFRSNFWPSKAINIYKVILIPWKKSSSRESPGDNGYHPNLGPFLFAVTLGLEIEPTDIDRSKRSERRWSITYSIFSLPCVYERNFVIFHQKPYSIFNLRNLCSHLILQLNWSKNSTELYGK